MNAFEADVQKEYAHGPEPLDRASVFSAGQSAYKRIGLVAMNIEALPEELKVKLAARLHVIQKESASMLADILQSFEEQEEITPEEIAFMHAMSGVYQLPVPDEYPRKKKLKKNKR